MSRKLHPVALALAAAALAVPISQAATGPTAQPKIDPLAVSYLRGHGLAPHQIQAQTVGTDPLAESYLRGQGLSPSQVKAWTVGACSFEKKPTSCFTAFGGTDLTPVRPVDPLAVSYLRGMGLSPDEIAAWTVGACSHESRPSVCYSAFEKTSAPVQSAGSGGFNWGDAGIGAGASLGIALLLAGLGAAFVISRQNRGRQAPSM
jgi:hypothetical protein